MSQERRGDHYFCVTVPSAVSSDGRIYAWADQLRMDGGRLDLIFVDRTSGEHLVNLSLAPGNWHVIFEADPQTGKPIAATRWAGELDQ